MSLLRNGNVIGGISKTLLSKIGFSDLTTGAQNLCDGVNELNSSKVNKSGDTMTDTLQIVHGDVEFLPPDEDEDTGDIIWKYFDGQERARIWTNSFDSAKGPSYRCYKADGTHLASGRLLCSFGDTMSGTLKFDYTAGADIEIPSRGLSYIQGAAGNAGLYAKKAYNVDTWYPAVCLQTKGGGSWQIGNYNNEKLEFAYATKANIDASKNTVSIIHFPENVNGTIYTTGNKPSAADVGALPLGGGTMTGAIGFNNATTRRNTAKNLTSENVTSPGFVVSLTDNWGTFGYSTIAQLKAKFGYGTIVTKNAGDYAAASHSHTYANMEFVGNSPHYIDFHWAGTTADYSARIIESSKGALLVYNSITNSSDRNLKKDIVNLDDNFLNLLNKVKPRQFRWKKGDEFLNLGFIAQEVDEALDEIGVTDKPLVLPGNDDGEIHTDWGLSYNQMIPILWRVCQIQQEKIENLEAAVKAL